VRLVSTVWMYTFIAVTLPVGYVMALVLLLVTLPFDRQRHALHHFVCTWCHQYLRCWPGWSVTVEGREHVPPGPCVMVANHQSMADILAIMGLMRDFKFVSKRSLFGIPFIGWMMRLLGYVALERGSMPSVKDTVSRSEDLLRQGERLVIFPEGTYAPVPERLPFKRGSFRLAQKQQVPVVPIVVEGTSELVFEDGPWWAPRGRVKVTVKPPLPPPAPDADDEAYAREVEARYEGWLGQKVRKKPEKPKP
jgi:1-acyl-sn-glycerol-3-phosphate acyltransferase